MKSVELTFLLKIAGMLSYFLIAAQGAFYLLGFKKALYDISAENFIDLRKAVDPVVRGRFKVLYLSALAVLFVWLVVADKSGGLMSYGCVLGAFLLLVADMILIVKFSQPLNATINEITPESKESLSELRHQWLKFIAIRGCLSVTGFVLLLIDMLLKAGKLGYK
jgi:uncharacterized membrane protein